MDALMFKDLIKLNKVLNGCLIFGLTATPNNYKFDDAKRRIIMELKFKSSKHDWHTEPELASTK